MFFGHSVSVWIIIVLGAVIRVFFGSGPLTTAWAVTAFASGLFCAVIGTDPLLKWMEIPPDDYKIVVAGLLALTGHGLIGIFVHLTSSWKTMVAAFKDVRGKK